MMDCKKCGQECYRESVDVGVGVIHGPWGCPCCGWSDDPEYDCSEGESPATKRTGFHCGPTGMLDPTQPIEAFEVLKAAIQRDESYAWSWHCNIAMPYQDEGASHEQGNRAAARAMSTIFGVDVTTFKEWKPFPWAIAIANAQPQGRQSE